MSFSKQNKLPTKSSPTLRRKGIRSSYQRQRKLKEAKEAAEQEVNKYRQQKEA